MIRYVDHKSGFSLIEVLIALAIAGTILVAFFGTQSQLLRSVMRSVHEVQATLAMENYLVESHIQHYEAQDKQQTQNIDDPMRGKLSYRITKIPTQSSLHAVRDLMIERVEVNWKDGAATRQRHIISLLYKVPEKVAA